MHWTRLTPRLPVADLTRAVEFYCAALGFEIGSLWPEDGPTFAILEHGDLRLQLYVPNGCQPGLPGQATLYLDCTGGHAAHARIARIAAVEWGPEVYAYGRLEFAFRDPDGDLIIVSEPIADMPLEGEPE